MVPPARPAARGFTGRRPARYFAFVSASHAFVQSHGDAPSGGTAPAHGG